MTIDDGTAMTATTKAVGARGHIRTRWYASTITATVAVLICAGILYAPGASADAAADLRSAVTQMRAGTSCGPLHINPVVEDVAYRVNKSTLDYLNHAAGQIPVTDPLPGLKILGHPGNKAALLQGASKNAAISIKALLLQGFDKVPDCSFTEFGTNVMYHEPTGYVLTVAVLAGP